jgi:pimeloyl-ACP methyl ester carboxylesterase
MEVQDVIALAFSVANDSAPDRTLNALQAARKLVPLEFLQAFDTTLDLALAKIRDNPQSITVVLIHGIRTDGRWEHLVRSELANIPQLNVEPLGYEPFSALGLWGPFRSGPIKNITRKLRDIRSQEPNSKIVVIAHSFGTYIISKILENSPDITIEKIILCGCIVKTDFAWDKHAPKIEKKRILNDVGTKDIFPVLAAISTRGYGISGRLGFQSNRVFDRYFDYGHSDCFTPKHINEYWKPFITNGVITPSEWDAQRPAMSMVMTSTVMFGKYVFFAIYIAIICLLFNWGSGLLMTKFG